MRSFVFPHLSFLWCAALGAIWWLFHTHLTATSITIYLHRASTHGALKLHPLLAHFFRFDIWFTTGTVTQEWVSVHRKHHRFADEVEDPHSPRHKRLWRVLWLGWLLYRQEAKISETLRDYGKGTPRDWIERHLYAAHPGLGVCTLLLANILLLGLVVGPAIWIAQMVWVPFWAGGVINGFGHAKGYRTYDTPDDSRNIGGKTGLYGKTWAYVVNFFTAGEGLHNNHHKFQNCAMFTHSRGEFDPGWFYIRVLERLGLAKDARRLPRSLPV